jgi:phospholipid transport system substrate-binding protein
MRNLGAIIPVIAAILLLAVQVPTTQAIMPAGKIQTMLKEVKAVQNNPDLNGQESRPQKLAALKKIFLENFYYEGMARQALGPHWGTLSKTEQADFKNLFQNLFQQSYARMVMDFLKDEEVVYKKEELETDHACVKTAFLRVNHEIPVDYSLMLVKGKWLISDISVDGVSMVGNYRRSFTQIIQRESFKSLLQKLRLQQKANDPASKPANSH